MQYCPYCGRSENIIENTYDTTDILSGQDITVKEIVCEKCYQTIAVHRYVTEPTFMKEDIQKLREEGIL